MRSFPSIEQIVYRAVIAATVLYAGVFVAQVATLLA